jgi:hypothetical protein
MKAWSIEMTIKHIVLLPFKPTISKVEIEKIMSALASLQDTIPEIMSFSWGENNSTENLHRGYLHGFVMEFKNHQDRQTYLEHADHVSLVRELLLPTLVGGDQTPIVFDYESK